MLQAGVAPGQPLLANLADFKDVEPWKGQICGMPNARPTNPAATHAAARFAGREWPARSSGSLVLGAGPGVQQEGRDLAPRLIAGGLGQRQQAWAGETGGDVVLGAVGNALSKAGAITVT